MPAQTIIKKISYIATIISIVFWQSFVLASEEEMQLSFSISLLEEDNINRGFFENDVHSDQITSFDLGVRTEIEINQLAAIFISANYQKDSYSDFTKLSVDKISGRIDYVFQTGFRFTNPSYTLSAAIEDADYGSQLRDSTTLTVAAKLLKRFTTKIKASTGLAYIVREADTNVFDIDTTRWFALVDYSLSQKISLYASYALHDGGSVSTITTTDPDLLAQQVGYATINEADAAGALLPDDAFGGSAAGQFAYQNDASTTILEFGSNFVLNHRQALDLSVKSINTELDAGNEYDNFLFLASYLARF